MIEVNNLVKRYGDNLAVDHLSFRVEKGQIYGFLGPNGAGKSTTMNIITGYLACNEGTVVINGHDILQEPEAAKRCIGYLPEQPPLYMDMTVWEALLFAAELKGVAKSERIPMVEQVMEKTFVAPVKDRLIKNLSKGYKQRVGLAQALLANPEILILDEPTVGLDPKQIIEIRTLIKELASEHTIILSSHILSEVSALCDTIMIISHGKLVACDSPEHLSEDMQGTVTLHLQILDREGQVENGLKEHFGDTAMIAEEQNLDSVWQGTIKVDAQNDIREELFYLLADMKCPILEMSQTRLSLEDIFLELTEDKQEENELVPEQGNMAEEDESVDGSLEDATQGSVHEFAGEQGENHEEKGGSGNESDL